MRSTEQSGAGGGRFRAPVPAQTMRSPGGLMHRLSAAFAAFRSPEAIAPPAAQKLSMTPGQAMLTAPL